MSGIPLLLGGSLPCSISGERTRIGEWTGMEYKHAFAAFPHLLQHLKLCASENLKFTPILSISTYTSPVLLQHCSLTARELRWCHFFFSFRQSALKEFSTQFGPPTQPAPLLVPKTINQKDFYPTSLPVSGIGQPQTSGLETGIFHSMRLRLKGLHTGSKQRLAPLCQWQYSYAS